MAALGGSLEATWRQLVGDLEAAWLRQMTQGASCCILNNQGSSGATWE